ncbi:MAG: hypothetical protein NTU73_13845, partial [Ignavibacteriae bacterium]|nr:hypothetical protein [Ignavibacteriota bacterium]
MRTKIVFSVLLVLAVAVFYFSKPNAKENSVASVLTTPGTDTTFRIGVYWDGMVLDNYDSLKELGLNLWQVSSSINSGWTGAGVENDFRDSSYSSYGDNVKQKITSNMSDGNLKTIMDRPKINHLGLGKRSDYQCEDTCINTNYWFYYFREHDANVSRNMLDNSQFGSNSTYVRYSSINEGKTFGYVVKGLIANREQISFPCSQSFKWYIMPRIRIDSAFANNIGNFNKPVC